MCTVWEENNPSKSQIRHRCVWCMAYGIHKYGNTLVLWYLKSPTKSTPIVFALPASHRLQCRSLYETKMHKTCISETNLMFFIWIFIELKRGRVVWCGVDKLILVFEWKANNGHCQQHNCRETSDHSIDPHKRFRWIYCENWNKSYAPPYKC